MKARFTIFVVEMMGGSILQLTARGANQSCTQVSGTLPLLDCAGGGELDSRLGRPRCEMLVEIPETRCQRESEGVNLRS